jgi:hypothetical protein
VFSTQTTNSVEESLEFKFDFSSAMTLVPMDLGVSFLAVFRLDECNTFKLPPIAGTVPFDEVAQHSDSVSFSNGFDSGDRTKELEVHESV